MTALPALSVDIEARIEKFVAGMQALTAVADKQVTAIEDRFRNLNPGVSKWLDEAKVSADNFAVALGAVGLAFVGFKVLSAIIGEAREQLAEMVEIANKAQNLNISPYFLQSFETEARKLQVGVKDLDGALSNAFQATKEKSPIDLAQWETAGERVTEVEKALRVYNETIAKAAGTQLQGLVLFRDAQDQQTRIIAVLQAMKQLNELGHQLEALDLGERMFGAKFSDNIRLGKTSAESLLQSLEAASRDSAGLFSDDVVRRAKEIDDKLQAASDHLSRELKPNWEAVASVINDVKSLYADIVELSAKIVSVLNSIDLVGWASKIVSTLGTMVPIFGALATISTAVGALHSASPEQPAGNPLRLTVTPQSRGPGAVPTLKAKESADTEDAYDRATEAITRQVATLKAETETIGMNSAARAEAIARARLWAAAIEAGRENEAGIAEKIAQTSARIRDQQAALDAAQKSWSGMNSALQFGGNQVISILDGLRTKSMTAADALRNLSNVLITALEQAALLGSGPLAGVMGTAPAAAGGTGGLFGWLAGLSGRAEGGPVNAGQPYLVGERGMPELFIPSMSGTIVPARGSGGHSSVVVAPTVNVTMPAGAGAQDGQAFGASAAQTIVAIVKQTLVHEQRSGGLLATA